MFPNKSRTDFLDNPDDVRSAFGIRGVSQHQEPLHDDPPPTNLKLNLDLDLDLDLQSFPASNAFSCFGAILSASEIRRFLGRNSRLSNRRSSGS